MFKPKFKKRNMKAKPILGFFLAVLTVASMVMLVSATPLNLTFTEVQVNGDSEGLSETVAVFAGDIVPVRVEFTADEDSEGPLEISMWIQGAKSQTEVERELNRDLLNGSRYSTSLSVFIPSDLDDDDVVARELTLVIRIESDEGSIEQDVALLAQRKANSLDVLLVDFDSIANAGSTLPVTVVLQNTGSHKADDTFVTVSVSELGLSRTVFFSDLFPVENCDDDDVTLCDNAQEDNEDTLERRIFLSIPSGAAPGIYNVEVTAVSDDASTSVIKPLTVVGTPIEGSVLSNPVSKTFSVGETVTYDLILVNTGNKIGIYNLVPEASDALSVTLSDTLTTVPAGSSKTVKVFVKANREGTFDFAVNTVSEGFSERAVYTANVQGRSVTSGAGNNVILLTIVLEIIFVVLLVILIVLLSRKPERSEEFGESYY